MLGNYLESFVVDEVKETDFLRSPPEKVSVKEVLISGETAGISDAVSLKVYGAEEFWWLVLFLNPAVMDAFASFQGGDIIKVTDSPGYFQLGG